jgi:hypothetical protein
VRGVARLANVGEELHHQLALFEPSEIGHLLLKDTQHSLVMVQIPKPLEHERTSAVAAGFTSCDGVRLTRRATVVDVAPRQVLHPELAEIALKAHSRMKPLEHSRSSRAPLEASTAGSS